MAGSEPVKFNPHFLELKLGRCEIALKPGFTRHRVLRNAISHADFTELIGSMFLTEPPCRALGIYDTRLRRCSLGAITRVCDEGGVRIGHFLSALREPADEVLTLWLNQATEVRRAIHEPHWTAFTRAQDKHHTWIYYGSPKYVVFLGQIDDGSDTLAKEVHSFGEDFSRVSEGEGYSNVTTDQTLQSRD